MNEFERLINNFEYDLSQKEEFIIDIEVDKLISDFLYDLKKLIDEREYDVSRDDELEEAKDIAYDDGCRSVINNIEDKAENLKHTIEYMLSNLANEDVIDSIIEEIDDMVKELDNEYF